VATLVARETTPDDACGTVGREVGEGSAWTPRTWVGERFPLAGTNVGSTVLRTGRTARLNDVC
jgi:hypothetical protein